MKTHRFPVMTVLLAALLVSAGCQSTPPAGSGLALPLPDKAAQLAVTPAAALAELKAGNERFATGRSRTRDLTAQRRVTAAGQYPFAVVVTCLDSRSGPEQIFDQGIGDLFSARVAGNVLNDDILGSLEFGCEVSGAKLIAVVGHSSCGAIKGACAGVQLGHLTGLLDRIRPAVVEAGGTNAPAGPERIERVAEANVRLVVRQIREQSPILAGLVERGRIAIVGAMYDLATGRVTFLE